MEKLRDNINISALIRTAVTCVLAVALVFSCAFGLAGCGEKAADTPKEVPAQSADESKQTSDATESDGTATDTGGQEIDGVGAPGFGNVETTSPNNVIDKPALWKGKTPQEYGCNDEQASAIYEFVITAGNYDERVFETGLGTYEGKPICKDYVVNSYYISASSSEPNGKKVCVVEYTLYGVYEWEVGLKEGSHASYHTIDVFDTNALIYETEKMKRELS